VLNCPLGSITAVKPASANRAAAAGCSAQPDIRQEYGWRTGFCVMTLPTHSQWQRCQRYAAVLYKCGSRHLIPDPGFLRVPLQHARLLWNGSAFWQHQPSAEALTAANEVIDAAVGVMAELQYLLVEHIIPDLQALQASTDAWTGFLQKAANQSWELLVWRSSILLLGLCWQTPGGALQAGSNRASNGSHPRPWLRPSS